MTGFATDRVSGSGEVARAFLVELGRWADVDTSPTPVALRAALLEWLRAAIAAQPAMALIHQLAARALAVADAGLARGAPTAALREELARTAAAERGDLEEAHRGVVRQASALFEQRGEWIATLSASGAVRDALLAVHAAGRQPRALVAESRPGLEGRALAAALAAAGLPAWLVVDAALPMLLSQARMVWIGADAVTDQGVLNKIGSYAAALAAREHGVPVYALAARRKFVPAATPALRIPEMPPGDVWDAPPAGVQARSVYFELVPMALLRGVVVEDGVLPPGEAAALARERPLPGELAGP